MNLPSLNPRGYVYRALKQKDDGWDVFALQTALMGLELNPGPFDGIWGPKTQAAVLRFQEFHSLTRDGIAGVITQRTLSIQLILPVQRREETPPGLMRGQVEKESAFLLGNHSPRRPDGNYDVGVTQRNTQYLSYSAGFNAIGSVQALGNQLRQKYEEYRGYGKVKTERRLWELAAGSWNAPAWTDRLARGQSLSQSQSDHIEAYIGRVTVYLAENP